MSQNGCHKETFVSRKSATLLLEVAWGCAREKFAISASVDAAPAVVKVAQSSPVMFVSRLTINVARKSLRPETDAAEKCQGEPFTENAEHERLRFRQDGVAGETASIQRRGARRNNCPWRLDR